MELNRFRPYGFTTMFEVLDFHINQVNYMLVRYMFTEEQFLTRQIPTKLRDFEIVIRRGLFDIIVVLSLLFANLEIFPVFRTYNRIIGDSFRLKEPKKISFSYLIVILCLLDCIYMSMIWLKQGRFILFRVLYEARRTSDTDIKSPEAYSDLLSYFNIASYATGLNLKAMAIIMFFLVYQVCKTSILYAMDSTKHISPYEAALCMFIFASCQLQFALLQTMCYSLLCGLFLILKIFKYQTRRCLQICAKIVRNPRTGGQRLTAFRRNLMNTHRRINWYNLQVKEYNFAMDCLSMLATTWALANVLKSPDTIGFIFVILFFTMYGYSYFMGERMAFFKECTKIMIKQLHSFAVMYSRCKLAPREAGRRLDRLIKVDDVVNFLNNAKFGFTYGSQYMFTKRRVVENALVYVYVLMLLSKTKKKAAFGF